MKLSSISNNNQPNFKAVWSKQTLETARKIGEMQGVNLIEKLNAMLDSNEKLKKLGGDKIELSLGSSEIPAHWSSGDTFVSRVPTKYEIACKATVNMPDNKSTLPITIELYNPGHPEEYLKKPYGFDKPQTEEQVLYHIAANSWLAQEVDNSLNYSCVVDNVIAGLYNESEEAKKKEITAKYRALKQQEIASELPKIKNKLYDYLYRKQV